MEIKLNDGSATIEIFARLQLVSNLDCSIFRSATIEIFARLQLDMYQKLFIVLFII